MNVDVWLKIGARKSGSFWRKSGVQAFCSKPTTKNNEIAVKVSLEIPDAVFEEPVFNVKLKLPEVTRQLPEVAAVASEVQEALNQRLGFRVLLSMEGVDAEISK